MAKRSIITQLRLESSRAAKRIYFDVTTVKKQKFAWLEIEVGESFVIPVDQTGRSGPSSTAHRWANICGRTYSVSKQQDNWKVTRTA